MSNILFTFEDITIKEADLEFLRPGEWLNDQIISFAFAQLEKKLTEILPVRFLDCCLLSCLRLQMDDDDNEDDLPGFIEGIGLLTSSQFVIPLSNKLDRDTSSSHWSLLYLDIQKLTAFHFDSMNIGNIKAAEVAVADIFRLLNR